MQKWSHIDKLDEALYLGWYIWYNRNQIFHNNVCKYLVSVLNAAHKLHAHFVIY